MKRAYAVLFIVFVIMAILNVMKPLSSDDYFAAFVWQEGTPINGELVENPERVSGLTDIVKSTKSYYLTWGGRVPGGLPVGLFMLIGKEYFNPINALMFVVLIMEIYWLSHEGKVSFTFKWDYVLWIFFSLWAFNISFNDTCLWLSGSCNYLWMVVIVLAFIIPYVKHYFYDGFNKSDSFIGAIGMFLLGIIAGCSFEVNTCWILLVLMFYLYFCKKRNNLQFWQTMGFLGMCIGYGILVFAPGNFSRLSMQQHTDRLLLPAEFLTLKLEENLLILSFHLFLWYFLLKFFFNYYKTRKENNKYLNFAKACIFIAFCSGALMFLIPSEGYRPSFVNLVSLTTAASAIYRYGEMEGRTVIPERGKHFLKTVGYFYLVITVIASLWGNYLNWCHWDLILKMVSNAKQNISQSFLEVKPYPVGDKHILMLLSGFHIIVMPFNGLDEHDSINSTFSKYYGIKGIKVVPNDTINKNG